MPPRIWYTADILSHLMGLAGLACTMAGLFYNAPVTGVIGLLMLLGFFIADPVITRKVDPD